MRFTTFFLSVLLFCACQSIQAQTLDTLPGGIVRYADYDSPEGFYIFYPAIEGDVYSRDSLGLVIFTHGYGSLNPLNYAAWLRHIVEQRQVVIYPRYQRNLFWPLARAFAKTHHDAVTAALSYLDTAGIAVQTQAPIYVGHSYGGTLTAYALAKQDSLGYRPAFGAVLAAPGTSRMKGSRLASYAGIDPAAQVIIVSHEKDLVVGDEFAKLVHSTTPAGSQNLWLAQGPQTNGDVTLGASHNESFALDETFDTGYRNYTTRKALRIGRTDAVDRDLYWLLVDQMIAARRTGTPHPAFYNQLDEYAFGKWDNGIPRENLVAHYRGRAPVRSRFAGLSDFARLDLLTEDSDYLPPPKNIVIPYTLEEMLQKFSVPAEYEPPGEQ